MKYRLLILPFVLLASCRSSNIDTDRPKPLSADCTQPVHQRSIDEAIAEGVKFLISTQNPDGSWGTGKQTRGTEIMASVPGSHDAFRIAVTGLASMALREAGENACADRGIAYLVDHAMEARRSDPELLYNTWAHTYALQALAMEYQRTHTPDVAKAMQQQIQMLARYENVLGGWNYYDFEAKAQTPSMGATSFGTSATLVALYEARKVGIDVPQPIVARAIRRVADCRLPNGSFMYGSDYQYVPRLPANQIKGSIGRTQSANFALLTWNYPKVSRADAEAGFQNFVKEHAWINMGRKRPMPHEAWYQTSGYYYYFGHYYASRLIQTYFDGPDKALYARQLSEMVLPYQEADGSWWDYAMWDYHKPYGTSFSVMILLRCKQAMSNPEAK